MFIAASVTVSRRWQLCPAIQNGIEEVWSVMQYHSALNRKGILTHAETWINREDITLS